MPTVDIPGSKSITARALFLAAAADGVTTLTRPLRSDDTEGFAEGLVRLGYRVVSFGVRLIFQELLFRLRCFRVE